MDANNYVAPEPTYGGYAVVVNGQEVGWANSQAEAERLYNEATQQANAPRGGTGQVGGWSIRPAHNGQGYTVVNDATGTEIWHPTQAGAQAKLEELTGAGPAARPSFGSTPTPGPLAATAPGRSGFNTSSNDYFNPQVLQITAQTAIAQAQQAYNNKRLELIDLPMLAVEKDKLALQAATEAANQALQTAGVMAQLRGPRNAFTQMGVATGLNSAGLSKAVDALAGRATLPSFQGPQTAPEAGTLQTLREDMLLAGGKPPEVNPFDIAAGVANRYYSGGRANATTPVSAEQALDAIWAKRQDLADFYKRNGWMLDTPEQKRAAATDWLGMTTDPDVVAQGRDALKLAKAWQLPGFGAGGIVTQPTLALIGEEGPEQVTPLNGDATDFKVPTFGEASVQGDNDIVAGARAAFTTPPANTNPAAPPSGTQPTTPPPLAPGVTVPGIYQQINDYIAQFKQANGRDLTEQEWINYVMGRTGLSYGQAKWVRDQGMANYQAGKGWGDEALFNQFVGQAQGQQAVAKPPPRGNDWYEQFNNYWADFQTMNGRQPTRDEMIAQLTVLSGRPQAAVASIVDQGIQYARAFGHAAPKEVQERWLAQQTSPATPMGAYFPKDWLNDMNNWWQRFAQQNGRKPNQQEYVSTLRLMTGATEEAANEAWKQGTAYFNQTGVTMPQAEQEKLLTRLSSAAYQYGRTLPPPSQIVAREWLKLDKDTQDTMLAAYEAMGYSPSYVLELIQRSLPKFSAPAYGMVA